MDFPGLGSGREGLGFSPIEEDGASAAEIEKLGMGDTLMDGTEGASSMWIDGGSGALMVGMTGADAMELGRIGFERFVASGRHSRSRLPERCGDKSWRLISAVLGAQFLSKLTIGLPFALLTTVGDGSLGLRSLSLMDVAARMSSLRTSRASGVPAWVAKSWSSAKWGAVEESPFRRYEGFRD